MIHLDLEGGCLSLIPYECADFSKSEFFEEQCRQLPLLKPALKS